VVPGRLGHRDFIVLSLYWIAIGYLWRSLGGFILPDLVVELVGDAHKGAALSFLEIVGAFMAMIWQPVVGAVSDRTRTRWGRRHPYIAGATLGDALFLAGIALSGGYWVLVLFYFLLQMASNTAQGPYQGLMPDVVPEEQRGEASGYYGLANLVGILAGTVGAGILLARAGRTLTIASIVLLLLVTMLATVILIPDKARPTERQFRDPFEALRTTLTTPLRHRTFLWLMASRLLILMGIAGMLDWTFYFFGDVFFRGNRAGTIAANTELQGLVILASFLVTWPAARLSDRTGRRRIVLIGGLVAALGVAVLVFAHYQWLPDAVLKPLAGALAVPVLAAQAMLAGLLIGIGSGAFLSVDWAFIQDVIPGGQAGLFMGFSNIATAGAGGLERLVVGFVLDPFNAGPPILGMRGGYPVVFSIFAVWLVLGSFAILKVPERASR
jgi:MFS family permease